MSKIEITDKGKHLFERIRDLTRLGISEEAKWKLIAEEFRDLTGIEYKP